MPILAPVAAFLGTTAGAVTASAVVGAGTALLSNNAANKANKSALAAQSAATDKSLAAQQVALDRITALNQPFINAGQSVLSPLASRVNAGAPNFSSPSYARPQGYRAPAGATQPELRTQGTYQDRAVPMGAGTTYPPKTGMVTDPASVGPAMGQVPPDAGTDAFPMPGPAPSASRGFGPTAAGDAAYRATVDPVTGQTNGQNIASAMNTVSGGSLPGSQAAQAAGPDWDAYIAANPDVAAWIKEGHGDPNLGPNQTPEQAAAFQFHNTGQSEGRAAPPNLRPQGQGSDPAALPPQPLDLGTASPVVAEYTRPDQPATPDFGAAPNAADYFDQSKFQTSPDYQWRVQQGQRNLNANFGARGLLKSGGAIEGAIDYGQHQASNEFGNWFARQQQLYADTANQYNANRASGLNQFNTDRNNLNNNFADDRAYGTNLAVSNRDFANGQYNTQTQNLFQLAGIGANAAGAISGANNSYANNASNLYTAQGNNQADAAYNRGSAQQQLYGTLGSTVSNLFSSPSRSGGGTPIPVQTSGGSDPFALNNIFAPNAYATNLTQVPTYRYGGTY
jgi:hypothetical protein